MGGREDYESRKELDINRIKNLFIQIKLNIFSKGATYLLEIIKYCYYDENLIDNMKHLYTMVSCKYTVSSKSVQWSIENSLKLLSKNVDVNILNSIFLYNDLNSRISPKQFIENVNKTFDELIEQLEDTKCKKIKLNIGESLESKLKSIQINENEIIEK